MIKTQTSSIRTLLDKSAINQSLRITQTLRLKENKSFVKVFSTGWVLFMKMPTV